MTAITIGRRGRSALEVGVRAVMTVVVSLGVLLTSAPPVGAHGGGDATSNYRTRISGVQPAEPGVTVRLVGVDGTVELTYTGTGTLTVFGYEDEPYLRLGPAGVERNVRSPATYLNQDRFADVALPASADASAAPEWEQISAGRTIEFHDHRTHWMSSVPPAQVQADPDRLTVIYERWKIPLIVDGRRVTISGDLTWVPPPSRAPWLSIGAALAIVAGAALLTRNWQRVALVVAGIGTVLLCVDTIGYWRLSNGSAAQRAWLIGWPVVAVVATVAVVVMRRRAATAGACIALSALVVAAIGGWDRIDVVTHSQIHSTNPDWLTRASAVACLVLGAALLIRFLADLVPRAVGTGTIADRGQAGTAAGRPTTVPPSGSADRADPVRRGVET